MTASADPDLASRARMLVERLGGRWNGRGGMCRCPAHDDRTPSLSIRLGDYGLLYHCFAGCDTRDVLRAVRRLDRRALDTTEHPACVSPPDDDGPSRRIRALWDEATAIVGTPAERYLAGRGLAPPTRRLRFHPLTPLGSGAALRRRPAILAAVQDGPVLIALHRTFLAADGTSLATDLDQPRRMLGRPGRGAVRLSSASPTLGIAEGMETALAAMQLLNLPVWAVLGNERLAHVTIPLGVRRLLILADDDAAGRRGAAIAAQAHDHPGRAVIRLWPGGGHNDWNDRLRSEGKGVGNGRRHVA